jgi:hypothetical protein
MRYAWSIAAVYVAFAAVVAGLTTAMGSVLIRLARFGV